MLADKQTVDLSDEDLDWTRFLACAWHKELADPREDIYTLEDGETMDTLRPGAA